MHRWSLEALNAEIRSGRIPFSSAIEYFLARIERHAELNAYISVACEFPTISTAGLGGVPIAIKDLLNIEGQETTAASKVLAGNVAGADAEVISRLRGLGACLIGKTNLHEFAYGGSGMISAYGPGKNPWNMEHITGGSSSGSAAAVAAGLCAAAIGTDTAGSIRLPASLCGIVGFKPTYDAISTEGVIPLSVSYDHVGPMTRSVEDARYLFSAMSGTELPAQKREGKLRVGIPETFFYSDLDPSVAKAMDEVLDAVRAAGHEIVRRDFEVDEDRTLASYESYAYHRKWVEECPELYQPETLRRIKSGEKITSEAAGDAASRLKVERTGAAEVFTGIDVMLTPTVPILPPRIADLLEKPETLRPAELLMLRNTRPFNVLGVPTISVPWDLSPSGLPIGIQLAAAPKRDYELLDIAEEFEKMSPWRGRVPAGFE
ncbi:Amidase [Candidatus Koribacter versatilis Ellin345]|uniref:Amidase n=1 Tax=Koribacter versatilis (strain Ellin345) TaxID=204669 RepID=Q1IRK5_KORVE|nr:amidase [Candidatus Koribacter versatilis]ABF40495.1 Amidase [Candidatus Koribacter versatilis Ellin345]